MADQRIRSGVRKRNSLKLGRRVVQFKVGKDRDLFTVHEDLICVSPYFRDMLKPRRRTIEGTCSICQEDLDPKMKELVYCSKSCGNNFHMACMEEWHKHSPSDGASTCPTCRQNMTITEAWGDFYDLPAINADAFDIYTEWLYKSSISKEYNALELMHAYLFGDNDICDRDFCRDVLCAIIARFLHIKGHDPLPFIKSVYLETRIGSPLRALLVGLYMQLPREDLSQEMLRFRKGYAPEFLIDLVRTLALKGAGPPVAWEYEALKHKLLTCSWTI